MMSKFIINVAIETPMKCVDVEKEFLRMLARRNKMMFIHSVGIVNVDDLKDPVVFNGAEDLEEKIKNEPI